MDDCPSPEAWRRFGEIAFISLTRLAERDAESTLLAADPSGGEERSTR